MLIISLILGACSSTGAGVQARNDYGNQIYGRIGVGLNVGVQNTTIFSIKDGLNTHTQFELESLIMLNNGIGNFNA